MKKTILIPLLFCLCYFTSVAYIDLTVINPSLSPTSIMAGNSLKVYCSERNLGNAGAGSNVISVHLSSNTILTPGANGDIWIGDISVSGCSANSTTSLLNTTTIILPNTLPSGTYYIFFSADGGQVVAETNSSGASAEGNNFAYLSIVISACSMATPSGLTPGGISSSPTIINTTTPLLQWAADANATCYGVYIRNVVANVLIYNNDAATTTNSFTVPSGLLSVGGQYRWNCLAKSGCSNSNCLSAGATSVYFNVTCPTPSNPGNPSSNSPQSNNVTITRFGTPPSGETWYWQGSSCSTTTTLGSGTTFDATSSGTYFIRAQNSCGNWSTGCDSIDVIVNSTPGTPATPPDPVSNSPQAGSVTITRSGTKPAGETWYWQDMSCGKSTNFGSGTSYTATTSGTYYIRAQNSAGIWSSGCGSVNVTVNSIPGTPATPPDPISNSPQAGSVTITRSGTIPAGETWYWQDMSCGKSTNFGSGTTYTAGVSGTYYIRAQNSSGIWSAGCGKVDVIINSPDFISGTVYNYSTTNATPSLFSGASVELLNSNGNFINNTTTNNDGKFQFLDLLGSDYQIRVSSGSGPTLVTGTTTGINPGTNLSTIKLPYLLHNQTYEANSKLSKHLFDFTLGYLVSIPINISSFNTSSSSNYLQSNLATFNSDIDKKIQALQRMLALFNALKSIDNHEADMIQKTTEEMLNAIAMAYSIQQFVKKLDMLNNGGYLNLFNWAVYKIQKEAILESLQLLMGTLHSIISFNKSPEIRVAMRRVLDGGFALAQTKLDADNTKDFKKGVLLDLINEIITGIITPIVYKTYFTDPIQNNLNQSVQNLANLNIGNSTQTAISNLNATRTLSDEAYIKHATDLAKFSGLAEGLITGAKINALVSRLAPNRVTALCAVLLGLASFGSEGAAIGVGLAGIAIQKEYARSACNISAQKGMSLNGYSMFMDSLLNDSLHILFLKADTAISAMQDADYSMESAIEYVNIDSNINGKITALITRLNNQFIAVGDSSRIDSFYNYLAVTNSNLTYRSNFNFLIASKIGGFPDAEINDSLSFYSASVKTNNILTDSVLKNAVIVSSNMSSPAYFSIKTIPFPPILDTGLVIPISVVVRLHSDTSITGNLILSSLSYNIDTTSKVYLPNKNDTITFLINTGSTDSVILMNANVSGANAIEASQNITVKVQSLHANISISGKSALCTQDSSILVANAPPGYIANWQEQSLGADIGSGDSLVIHSGFPGIFKAIYTDTVTSKSFYSQNSIEITNPLPILGGDKSVTIVCSNETTDISNLFITNGLATLWSIENPTMAGLGIHGLIATNSYGCTDTARITVKQDIQTWLGNIDDNWHNPLNWSNNSVPGDSTHVIIGPTIYPCIIKNNDATSASIQVKEGGIFQTINSRKSFIKSYCDSLPEVGKLATINTFAISNISTINATSGGTIISDGGNQITARGVCWSTNPNPTIANRKTTNGTGKGNFTSSLTGLTANSTFYLRAYATNKAGTNYGNNITFSTPLPAIRDIDGNQYPIINICSQNWTSKNLEVTHYKNGDTIPQVQDPSIWSTLTSGAWCYYLSNTSNGPVYGKLYNWYAVNDPRGLAPAGWHVPSSNEWAILSTCLGGTSTAGGKLKTTGTIQDGTGLWLGSVNTATNSSGFSGVPAGLCTANGSFANINAAGFWWSATQSNSTNASYWEVDQGSDELSNSSASKKLGFSMRCVKD